MKHFLNSFFVLFALSSCQHFIHKKESEPPKEVSEVSHASQPSELYYQDLEESHKSSYGDIPLDNHPEVDKWIRYFTDRGRNHMQVYLQRSSRYLPIMKAVLRENDLPVDLVYVALIESGFSSQALSYANAVGYWQFIYGTGKRYGLKIDGFVDERKDFILSTRAAAQYFKDLYSLFGSWYLALAAYNCGEYRVNRAVLRHYNRDFWYLSSKKALPAETRNYVPKLIAAIRIAKDPQKYGFYDIDFQPLLSYETVEAGQGLSLKKLSQSAGLDYDLLKSLNPSYKGEYVPIYQKVTKIRVPVGAVSKVKLALNQSLMSAPVKNYRYHYWYRVKKGDSLYKIARRNKTTVKKLRRENNLGRASLIRVGQKIKVPTSYMLAKRISSKKAHIRRPAQTGDFHVVQKGENLLQIAKLYGLNFKELKSLNNIQGNSVIYPKQKLRIKKKSSSNNQSYHLVRQGETLIGIANQYKIPLLKLMEKNSLNFKSVLLAGKKLVIPGNDL